MLFGSALGPGWVFAALLVLNLTRWLVSRSKSGFLQEHKARLALEIASLRRQAEAFNSPSTYVKCAKFQRLANAKEKELSALQASGGVSVQDRLDAAVAVCKFAFIALVMVICWGKALVYVPPHLTWPFGRLLAFPHTNDFLATGGVAVIPWIALCDRVTHLVARAAFPRRFLDLRTKPLSTVHEEEAVSFSAAPLSRDGGGVAAGGGGAFGS